MVCLAPLIRRRRLVVALFAAVAAAFAPGLLELRIDNSPEGFFVRDEAALERFRRLELDFGRDRGVRLVLDADGIWTREGLAQLAELEEAASDPRRVGGGVSGVAGPYRHHRWHLPEWPPADPEAFRELLRSDAVARNAGWVSRDGRRVTVLVGLHRMEAARQEATLAALEALVATPRPGTSSADPLPPRPRQSSADPLPPRPRQSSAASGGGELRGYVVGLPVVVRAVDDALAEFAARQLPAVLLAAAALLLALFRHPVAALLPLALVAVCQTVLFGAMGYAGQRLDVVTLILVPLVFVIALATGIHVLAYHRRLAASGPAQPGAEEAVLATYRVKAWPVLWTGLTTCVGFGSLALAQAPPVRMFGLWAAFGIAYLTLAALAFYPALLASVEIATRPAPAPRARDPVAGLSRLGRIWAAWAVARRRTVLTAFGAVALVAALGLPRLAVETNVLEYFAPEHPVRAGIAELEARGIGAVSASLVVAAPAGSSLREPAALRRLAALAAELRAEPQVLGAVSAGDLVAGVARHAPASARLPGADPLEAARARIGREPDLGRLLAVLEAGRGERSRVILSTRVRGHRELDPLYRRAEELARRAFPEAAVWTTGQFPLVLAGQRSLLRTMVASLTVAFLLIAGTFRWLLGSAAVAFRAVLPNAWAVLLVVGAMGWLGLPVDGATVMVAAVILGLAVDDTLHSLGHFRRLVRTGERVRSRADAAIETLTETAPGHASTSAALALGFAACALASLVPIARFGALAVLGLAGALAADLLLLPALLAGISERSAGRLRT